MTRILLAGVWCSIGFSERGDTLPGDLMLPRCSFPNLGFLSALGILISPLPRYNNPHCLPRQAVQKFSTATRCCSVLRRAHTETTRLLERLGGLKGTLVPGKVHCGRSCLARWLTRVKPATDPLALIRLVNPLRLHATMPLPSATGRAVLRYRGFSAKGARQRKSQPWELMKPCRRATPNSPARHSLALLDTPVSIAADYCRRNGGKAVRCSPNFAEHANGSAATGHKFPRHWCFRAWPEADEQSCFRSVCELV